MIVSTLYVLMFPLAMYTILGPVLTEDKKHLKYALLLWLLLGVLAFVLHVAKLT
jgi:hypothetical protein